jgi:hypothetical protein
LEKNEMKDETNEQNGCLLVPEMAEFFTKKREKLALMWVPFQVSTLFRDEFQQLCTQTKYVYVAIMLICGLRGTNELPFNIKYLAGIAGVDRRTMSKAIEELLCANMLTKRERKKERIESKEQTQQTDTREAVAPNAEKAENRVVLCEVEKSSETESGDPNQLIKNDSLIKNPPAANGHLSMFSLEECLRYAQIAENVRNPHGLANNLFKTGSADPFILAALYPERLIEVDRDRYGEARKFLDEPCGVCFGSRMEIVPEKGARPCPNCKNERGKPTGLEPERSTEC